ncbi:MAG: hypothetical protein ACJ8AI_13400 [Rhodopila sp.]
MTVNAKIATPWEIVDGKTISQWSRDWFQWVASADATTPVGAPFGTYPAPDGQVHAASAAFGTVGQDGPVFFLYGGPWGAPNPSASNLALDPTINVPVGKDILAPLINGVEAETGKAADSTLPEWPSTHLPYSVEAKFVPALVNLSIDEAHLSVAKTSDPTHPFLTLDWPASNFHAADSGVFSLGTPKPGSYLASVPLTGSDVPYADVAGRWAMIENLPKGDYVVNFGGSGHAIHNPLNPGAIVDGFSGPNGSDWKAETTDILHVA